MSEIFETDVNGDGVDDTVNVTVDADGGLLTTADTNADGLVDMATYDADADGVFETAAVDTNFDGEADHVYTGDSAGYASA